MHRPLGGRPVCRRDRAGVVAADRHLGQQRTPRLAFDIIVPLHLQFGDPDPVSYTHLGLEPGEQVAVTALSKLSDGVQVEVKEN